VRLLFPEVVEGAQSEVWMSVLVSERTSERGREEGGREREKVSETKKRIAIDATRRKKTKRERERERNQLELTHQLLIPTHKLPRKPTRKHEVVDLLWRTREHRIQRRLRVMFSLRCPTSTRRCFPRHSRSPLPCCSSRVDSSCMSLPSSS